MGIVANSGGTPQFLSGSISLDDIAVALNGNTDDLNPSGGMLTSQMTLSIPNAVNLTGIVGGTRNRQLRLINIGPAILTLKANAGSALGNRFIFASDISMAVDAVVDIAYLPDVNGWLLVGGSSSSGGSVTPTGNNVFTGSNEFDGAFLLNGVLTPAALAAGTTNDYAPVGLISANALRLTADAANSSLGGMLATGNGQQFLVVNLGAGLLTFLHLSGGSAPANEFICPGGSDFSLVQNGTCKLWYDGLSAAYRVLS